MSSFIHNILNLHGPWRLLNGFSFLANCFCTSLSAPGTGGLGRKLGLKDNKEVSDKYKNLTTPAGYAFSIWGVIFTLEATFTVWQLFASPPPEVIDVLHKAAPWWIGANLFQADWAFAFGWEMTTKAAIVLSCIAFCLLQVHGIVNGAALPYGAFTQVPFTLHFAWTTLATILNFNIAVKAHNFSESFREKFALASVCIAASFGALFLPGLVLPAHQTSVIPMGVVAWALRAIAKEPKDAKALSVSEEGLELFQKVTDSLAKLTIGACVVFGLRFITLELF